MATLSILKTYHRLSSYFVGAEDVMDAVVPPLWLDDVDFEQLICDNIKMGHARLAFERPRTVLTAMVGLYDAQAGRDKCAPKCVEY